MPENISINRITEQDFTNIIEASGGKRFSLDDSREDSENADYIFDDSIIELKLIEEEGLEKNDRHRKISELFSQYCKAPVIVLDTSYLSENDRREYYKTMETPIKGCIKKANSQLKISCNNIGKNLIKILIIVNNGYGALDSDEFKDIVNRRVKNDTSNIDYVICCGVYFYSDGFEHYVIFPFELLNVRKNNEPEVYLKLQKSWSNFVTNKMTSFYTEFKNNNAKKPVLDIEFDYDNRTFVKPAPSFGKKSNFWVNGRPRTNSTGINVCPTVATVFPQFSLRNWNLLQTHLADSYLIKDSYEEWISFSNREDLEQSSILKTLIQFQLDDKEIEIFTKNKEIFFSNLCELATERYNNLSNKIIDSIINIEKSTVFIPKYILVKINEIGRDEKNDLASIYIVKWINDVEEVDVIFENQRLFFEYAICLAASYAIKNKVDIIMYYIDKKYCWI